MTTFQGNTKKKQYHNEDETTNEENESFLTKFWITSSILEINGVNLTKILDYLKAPCALHFIK